MTCFFSFQNGRFGFFSTTDQKGSKSEAILSRSNIAVLMLRYRPLSDGVSRIFPLIRRLFRDTGRQHRSAGFSSIPETSGS